MKHNVAPPVEVAAHWVEHAILNGGAYLRTTAGQLSVVQYYLLDVVMFCVCLTVALLLATLWTCNFLCCRAAERDEEEKEKTS